MPELGETWCLIDSRPFIEGVVIATGPSMIRLADRYGRRITVPSMTWQQNWRLVAPPPSPRAQCHKCTQAAYFRFAAWDSLIWSCEEHLPYGSAARLPGDSSTARPPQQDFTCPKCHSSKTRQVPVIIALPKQRSTIQCACEECLQQWVPLLSLGLSDDGVRLAEDLHEVMEHQSLVQIKIGFTAYRNLCRTLNMGDVGHLRGVPVQMDPTLGDLLTLVLSNDKTERPLPPAPATASLQTVLCLPFRVLEILPASEWRRRTPDGRTALTCTVTSAAEEVLYSVSGQTRRQTRLEFLRYWLPGGPMDRPTEASIWMRRETGHVIQVLEATAIQAAHQQVHYVSPDGQRETTPLRTFQRLYRELPSPPEDQLWHSQGTLYGVERVGNLCCLRPFWPIASPPTTVMDAETLYSTCQPLLFSDNVNVTVDHRLTILSSGSEWLNKSSPNEAVTVQDVAVVEGSGSKYVRFLAPGREALSILEARVFCERYDYRTPMPPCRVGETWVSLGDPSRRCLIRKEDEPPFCVATVEWQDGELETLSHERLTSEFERLDIQSYWERLNADDTY